MNKNFERAVTAVAAAAAFSILVWLFFGWIGNLYSDKEHTKQERIIACKTIEDDNQRTACLIATVR